MPVIFVCSKRSCQVEVLWGFGTSRSCFFSPVWDFRMAQFKAPKLYTPPGNHSATALLSTCKSHVTSSRMKNSTRTAKGQPDFWQLSSKITVLFSLLCDVWGLAQVTLQIGTLSAWKGMNSLSVVCVNLLSCAAWFICGGCWENHVGLLGEGILQGKVNQGKGFSEGNEDLENIFQFLGMTEYTRKQRPLPHLDLRPRWWDSKTPLLGKRRCLCEEIWVGLITVGTTCPPFFTMGLQNGHVPALQHPPSHHHTHQPSPQPRTQSVPKTHVWDARHQKCRLREEGVSEKCINVIFCGSQVFSWQGVWGNICQVRWCSGNFCYSGKKKSDKHFSSILTQSFILLSCIVPLKWIFLIQFSLPWFVYSLMALPSANNFAIQHFLHFFATCILII